MDGTVARERGRVQPSRLGGVGSICDWQFGIVQAAARGGEQEADSALSTGKMDPKFQALRSGQKGTDCEL